MNDMNQELEVTDRVRQLALNVTGFVALFILYASLLPYNVTSSATDISLAGFWRALQFSPADTEQGQWIGHVIFNALLSFVASIYCSLSRNRRNWFVIFGSITVFGFLIEYFQMFIGSRGTSMADIFANIAGMLFGWLSWVFFGRFCVEAVKYFFQYETLTINFVKKLYLAFVIVVILFPFDFFINGLQLQVAFATKGFPMFESELDQGIGTISLFAAMVLTFPLGFLYRLARKSRRKKKITTVIKFGLLFLVLEILQFFEVSGQSSFPSFLLKFFGFCAGFYLARLIDLNMLLSFVIRMRKAVFALLLIFVWLALKIKGLTIGFAAPLSNIMTVIDNTGFLPFQYYVDVGSGEALLSFLLNFVIFVPIGAFFALHHIAVESNRVWTFSRLMRIGVLLSVLFELIVLIWGLKRPDVTNILVSAFALPIGFYLFMMMAKGLSGARQLN